METSGMLTRSESHRSVGTMLSSVDQGISQLFTGPRSCTQTPISKFSGSNSNAKRSTFWGRKNGRKTPSVESVDSSGEEE
nr:pleckstrin homology domain-containing protein [Tanacetum cinerariifolium]